MTSTPIIVQAETRTSPNLRKACDQCRHRKIRCDRKSPCTNCDKANVKCVASPRAQRPKRSRPLGDSRYSQGRIDTIDERLDRMGRLVNSLIVDGNGSSGNRNSESPLLNSARQSRSQSSSLDAALTHVPAPDSITRHYLQPTITQRPANTLREESNIEAEGSSSLSAHSTFAVQFLQKVAGSDRDCGNDFDTRELLGTLGHIVDALKKQQQSPEYGFPTGHSPTPINFRTRTMPPIESAVAEIRKTKEQDSFIIGFVSNLLPSQSLSDLCLKVYFSPDSSVAEFIILNVTLYFLFISDQTASSDPKPSSDVQNPHAKQCAENLEAALGCIPLFISPNHEMAVALALGATYSIEISRPSVAWTLTIAAHQTAHRLGFHTRQKGANPRTGTPNTGGLLFWLIFYLEKSLCLRLGRTSTIPDYDITVPEPGVDPSSSRFMLYCGLAVRFARVCGAAYEKLYSSQALRESDNVRRQRVFELSQELSALQEDFRIHRQILVEAEADGDKKDELIFMCLTDDVLQLSTLTLIHRAIPSLRDPTATFTDECITAARAALECHNQCVPALGKGGPSVMSMYMNWVILFAPFIPFIVLFCHVIETGDKEDLARIGSFVQSIESTCYLSATLENHHRLFQVFHSVAERYTQLKAALTPSQQEEMNLVMEMDSYLTSLGFQPPLGNETREVGGDAPLPTFSTGLQVDGVGSNREADQASQLSNWLFASQQVMGLLNQDQLPF